MRMGNFTQEEIYELWMQLTHETGQSFSESIFPELWEDTKGQPWLVNALGYEVSWKDRAARDRAKTITYEDYKAGRERLIYSCQTHLDQLTDKLRETRVHKVISALLSTEEIRMHILKDDKEAHLIIFNRQTDIPWEQKIMYKAVNYENGIIGVWGA